MSDAHVNETEVVEPVDSGSPPDQTAEPEAAGSGSSEAIAPQGREISTRSVVEAILFASDTPLPASKIAQIMGAGDAREVRRHVAALNASYEERGAAYRIEEIAGGFQMLTLPEYNTWLAKLSRARSDSKLSQAAMETLAVVAYRQPVLRADIEAIRGVSVGEVLNRLRELGLVKIVGRAEELGRPMLYGTTRRFLEVFGLSDIRDLPRVEELRPPETRSAAAPAASGASAGGDESDGRQAVP